MKTKCLRAGALSLAAGGLVLVSGCIIEPDGRTAFMPVVVVAPPPPVMVVSAEPVMVPDDYAWDGVEYVGFVGDQPFYLGPGNVWLVCEPFRMERFHGWERDHADWRAHAIRNDRYRNDSHGHYQSRHEKPGKAAPKRKEEQH